VTSPDRASAFLGKLDSVPIGSLWHTRHMTLTETIQAAERDAEKRATERACEYIAAYQMLLPVRFTSDVDEWKRGLIQSLQETKSATPPPLPPSQPLTEARAEIGLTDRQERLVRELAKDVTYPRLDGVIARIDSIEERIDETEAKPEPFSIAHMQEHEALLSRLKEIETRATWLRAGQSTLEARVDLDIKAIEKRLAALESAASPRPSKPEGELERAKKDLEHKARWVVEEWRAIPPGVYPGAARLGYALVELREAFDRLAAAER